MANASDNNKEGYLREFIHAIEKVKKSIYLHLVASLIKTTIDNNSSTDINAPGTKKKGECSNRLSNHMNLIVSNKRHDIFLKIIRKTKSSMKIMSRCI